MFAISNIFVDIPGTDGAYSCSKNGIIKSNRRWIELENSFIDGYFKEEQILKQTINNKGYCYVDLMINKKRKRMLVHRIVALTFIPNPHNFPVVNHKDFNPLNNSVDNLEWCTKLYNNRYSALAGRYKNISPAKEKAIHSKKTWLYKKVDAYDLNGNFVQTFDSSCDAGKFLVSIKAISNPRSGSGNIIACCKGKIKTSGGFIWKYHEE